VYYEIKLQFGFEKSKSIFGGGDEEPADTALLSPGCGCTIIAICTINIIFTSAKNPL